MAFSPDGRLLATASWDGAARVWDPASGQCLHTLTGHSEAVVRVAFSPDSRLLATACEYRAGKDDNVWLWDPANGRRTHTLASHPAGAAGVAFSPDGQMLATIGPDYTVRVWD